MTNGDALDPSNEVGKDSGFSNNIASELSEIAKENSANTAEQNEHEGFQSYQVKVDKEMLASAESLPPDMKEWLDKLPETLTFDEPVTLIVGKNGSGKTQFARALVETLAANREGADPRSMDFYLDDGEPAEAIAGALKLGAARKGNMINGFLEGSELMFKSREWAMQQAHEASRGTAHSRLGDSGGQGSATDHRQSSRQLFNQSVEQVLDMRVNGHKNRVFEEINGQYPANKGEVVVVFDEPEMGLSPDGQMTLAEDLQSFLPPSDTLLVPTNNFVLARCSDLPRLDISHPERGIHRPSEYDELYRLTKDK